MPPSLSTRLAGAALLTLALLAPPCALAEPSAIYLVRHGEKGTGDNPALTSQGRTRAQNLAAMLRKVGIVAVFSTRPLRTMQTAAPLARTAGVNVQEYEGNQPGALVARVKAVNDGAVLVVGHSDTVPELVRQFGGAPGANIAENEFDRVYQLHAGPDGKMVTVLLSSVAGAPH
jgi:broad specificity phosphatase PhoE